MQVHRFFMHLGASVILEARCFHVCRSVNKSRVVVSHALQLAIESRTHRALEPSHVVSIAVSTFKHEPRCCGESFFVLRYPFLNCLDRHSPPFCVWSKQSLIDVDRALSSSHFVRACAVLAGRLTKLAGNCPMSERYHKVCM